MKKFITFVLIFCLGLIISPAQDLNKVETIDTYSETILRNLNEGKLMKLWMEARTGLLDYGYNSLDCFIICLIPAYTGESGRGSAESAISQFLEMYTKEHVIRRSQVKEKGTKISQVKPNESSFMYLRLERHIEITIEN